MTEVTKGKRERGGGAIRLCFQLWFCVVLAVVAGFGCIKPTKPDVKSKYVSASTLIEFPDRKHFRITFEAGTRWGALGPLEGETTEFGNFMALLPKTLGGKTEEEISRDAFKLAQTQGIQTDLMAVGNLMRNVKLDIEENGKRLLVTDPPLNDPDKHPLAGATLVPAP